MTNGVKMCDWRRRRGKRWWKRWRKQRVEESVRACVVRVFVHFCWYFDEICRIQKSVHWQKRTRKHKSLDDLSKKNSIQKFLYIFLSLSFSNTWQNNDCFISLFCLGLLLFFCVMWRDDFTPHFTISYCFCLLVLQRQRPIRKFHLLHPVLYFFLFYYTRYTSQMCLIPGYQRFWVVITQDAVNKWYKNTKILTVTGLVLALWHLIFYSFAYVVLLTVLLLLNLGVVVVVFVVAA